MELIGRCVGNKCVRELGQEMVVKEKEVGIECFRGGVTTNKDSTLIGLPTSRCSDLVIGLVKFLLTSETHGAGRSRN